MGSGQCEQPGAWRSCSSCPAPSPGRWQAPLAVPAASSPRGGGGGEQGPVGMWPCVTASLQIWNCLPRSSNLPPPHFPWPVHYAVTGSARFRAISSCHCGDSPAPEGLLLPSCCGASGDEMASLHGLVLGGGGTSVSSPVLRSARGRSAFPRKHVWPTWRLSSVSWLRHAPARGCHSDPRRPWPTCILSPRIPSLHFVEIKRKVFLSALSWSSSVFKAVVFRFFFLYPGTFYKNKTSQRPSFCQSSKPGAALPRMASGATSPQAPARYPLHCCACQETLLPGLSLPGPCVQG